jgi:hypothetical protein
MISLVNPVKFKTDHSNNSVMIYTRPQAYFVVVFLACLIGLCYLPFSEFKNDYFAYVGLLFVITLFTYYFITNNQSVCFEKNLLVKVRKGFSHWIIPVTAIKGGYTSYHKASSQQTRENTHFIDFELKVNLPDNHKHWIRNGTANIFSYGFHTWGSEQIKIWDKFNQILRDNKIPVLTQ